MWAETLFVFTIIPFIADKLVVLKPEAVDEAYITTEFQNNLNSFENSTAKWPEDYTKMNMTILHKNIIFEFIPKNSESDKAFIRYNIRFLYHNRTYKDSEWIYALWNKSSFKNYYTALVVVCSLFVISLIFNIFNVLYMKYK